MTDRQQLLKILFNAVTELDSPEAQSEYLAEHCGDDRQLRMEVLELLAHDQHAEDFLQPKTLGLATLDAPFTEVAPQQIGSYKLREKLGEGGMGIVYVAEQKKPVRRKVALKIIKPGMATKAVIARFEAERQALAMMEHPHIARIIDAGTTNASSNNPGQPYFVMELVLGIPITQYCDEHALSTRERLQLFGKVCRAVQHAHQKGIIHRDLKPSNVLVAEIDGCPVPKVIDFGVAKAVGASLGQETIYTHVQQMVGTPLYMSPEQAALGVIDVDTRSDCYSLGVLLYEMLTGCTPFERDAINKHGLDEFRRMVREVDPAKPSHRVSTLDNNMASTISGRRKTDSRRLTMSLRREIDWIVMRALEKDRGRRYESASSFADDIERYLNDEPVQACPPSYSYLLHKYAKRNKGLLTTLTLVAATLLIATGVSVAYAVQAGQARDDANKEKFKAFAAQERSDIHLAAAMEAVDKLLEQVSTPELMEIPRVQPLLKQIVADALAFSDQYPVSKDDAPKLRFRAATTRVRLGQLASQLNDSDLSRKTYQMAITEFESLHRNFPEDRMYLESLEVAMNQLGWVNFHSQEFGAAEQNFAERLRLAQRLNELHPGPESRVALGEANYCLASIYTHLHRTKEAREHALRAYEEFGVGGQLVAEILATEDPNRAESVWLEVVEEQRSILQESPGRQHRSLFTSHLIKASAFFESRDEARAAEFADEALEHSQILIRDFPEIRQSQDVYRRALAAKFSVTARREPSPERDRQLTELLRAPAEYTAVLHEKKAELLAETQNAIPVWTEMIEEFPKQGTYYGYRGLLHATDGDMELALTDLRTAFELDQQPFNLGNRVGRTAQMLLKTNRPEDALTLAELVAEKSPESWVNNAALCAVRLWQKRFAEALVIADAILSKTGDAHYWIYKLRADANFGLGHFDQALADLQKSYELNPEDPSAASWIPATDIANCRDATFRDGMRALADRSVSDHPGSIEVLSARLELLLAVEDWEVARADLDDLVSRPDADFRSHYNLSLLLLDQGDAAGYRNQCQRMLERFAESESASEQHFTAWASALGPDAIEDYTPVIDFARQSVDAMPESQQYHIGLGAILLRAGRSAEAKVELTAALAAPNRDNTSVAYAHYFLALAEQQLEHPDEAKAQLAAANEIAEQELSEVEIAIPENDPADKTQLYRVARPIAWNRKLTLQLLRKEAELQLETKSQ